VPGFCKLSWDVPIHHFKKSAIRKVTTARLSMHSLHFVRLKAARFHYCAIEG
jgi:hypothetical protein